MITLRPAFPADVGRHLSPDWRDHVIAECTDRPERTPPS